MSQPRKLDILPLGKLGLFPVVTHLLCTNCLRPMRINIAEIADDGGEKVQFVCDGCGAATIRQYAARRHVRDWSSPIGPTLREGSTGLPLVVGTRSLESIRRRQSV
jgi:hypothetical protein